MPASYALCIQESLKHPEGYNCGVQMVLPGTEENPESRYRRLEEVYTTLCLPDGRQYTVTRFRAYQDVRHNKMGKAFGELFHWYLEPCEFYMYFVKDLNLMIFGTGKHTTNAFLNQMGTDQNAGFKSKRIAVDFQTLLPLLGQISGAWIADIKKQHIRSIGCFGTNVDQSEEFKAAAQVGAVSTLMFEYLHPQKTLKLSITESGIIVFHSRIKNPVTKEPDITSELDVVVRLYLDYLASGQSIGGQG